MTKKILKLAMLAANGVFGMHCIGAEADNIKEFGFKVDGCDYCVVPDGENAVTYETLPKGMGRENIAVWGFHLPVSGMRAGSACRNSCGGNMGPPHKMIPTLIWSEQLGQCAFVPSTPGGTPSAIENYAFFSSRLRSVCIPRSVKHIRTKAFGWCQELACVSFEPGSELETIEKEAFLGAKFSFFEMPASVSVIGEKTFERCSNLRLVTFSPNSVLEEIGKWAFYGCSSLESIVISPRVSKIHPSTFEHCMSLKTVMFPKDSLLDEIDEYAFAGCCTLESIECPERLERIGKYAFERCNALAVNFEKSQSLRVIETGAFARCGILPEINIPDSVQEIGLGAFYGDKVNISVSPAILKQQLSIETIYNFANKIFEHPSEPPYGDATRH
ncbi:MAG: leucine-rich repeat domain-containing protein [Holosporales bacterium]|nr:leucine-rich repeat domain-containing protein [Holosporales bacterium]